jgi:solute carrier family 34 (sodium-dependent phosphate cotransporter)
MDSEKSGKTARAGSAPTSTSDSFFDRPEVRTALAVVKLLAVLYLFFISIELMSSTFKLFGKDFAVKLIETTSNPIVGLFIGILATSVIQSSSSTTSIVVGLVASGALTIPNAIPIVMGANVGTSITNILVSMGHVTRREEFRRAVAGATVHDFFNLFSVMVFLPIEMAFGYLEKFAGWFELAFEGVGGMHLASPLKIIVKPIVAGTHSIVLDTFALSTMVGGVVMLVLALALLFFSLKQFVNVMRSVVVGRVEGVIHNVLFQSPIRSFALGMVLTATVQSSSITTSLIVPMIGAGILTVEQFYPYTLGANIGTTVTAIMAALATGSPQGVTIAFVHLLFNLSGCAIFYPLRVIPIKCSQILGDVSADNRWVAVAFVLVTFFLVPLALIFLTR